MIKEIFKLLTVVGTFLLQTPEQILEKIRSYSHGEFNNSDLDKKEIEERILNNEDIFKRGKTLKK